MAMINPLHEEFGQFHFALEATQTPNRYRLKRFPRFGSVYTFMLPHDGIVTLTSYDPNCHLPEPRYLQLHAAIGNILHASGRAEKIEELIRDLGETGSLTLSKDGSTNVGDLLSVSRLSLLASNSRPMNSKVGQPSCHCKGCHSRQEGQTQYSNPCKSESLNSS